MPQSSKDKSHSKGHRHHRETHYQNRSGWIRAGVLGADDGVVSIAALVMALVASQALEDRIFILTILSALIAGATSMAIGEYVSVASQKDMEDADIAKETRELEEEPEHELAELAAIYKHRGLTEELAKQVAIELTAHDALGSHLRDELGIVEETRAQPFQAAYVSFFAFMLGGSLPFVVGTLGYIAFNEPSLLQLVLIGATALGALGTLGFIGAKLGDSPRSKAMQRVLIGGTLALTFTSIIGSLFS